MNHETSPTIGSLFAGIGGFDLGFEAAGFHTVWQVELNSINRAVLADRFPHARQFADVRHVGRRELSPVDVLTAGFPCTDISTMGCSSGGPIRGLSGERSGLFHEVIRITGEIRPEWVVLENVPALLHSNDSRDLETVIRSFAERGYLGCFRVLDAQYFGVAQKRRRIFLVARLGQAPPLEFLADAAPVESISCSFGKGRELWSPENQWAGHTQTAVNSNCRINLGSELLIAEEDGWDQMVERARKAAADGIPLGLDAPDFNEAFSAGNAITTHIAEWIAHKIRRELAA